MCSFLALFPIKHNVLLKTVHVHALSNLYKEDIITSCSKGVKGVISQLFTRFVIIIFFPFFISIFMMFSFHLTDVMPSVCCGLHNVLSSGS